MTGHYLGFSKFTQSFNHLFTEAFIVLTPVRLDGIGHFKLNSPFPYPVG